VWENSIRVKKQGGVVPKTSHLRLSLGKTRGARENEEAPRKELKTEFERRGERSKILVEKKRPKCSRGSYQEKRRPVAAGLHTEDGGKKRNGRDAEKKGGRGKPLMDIFGAAGQSDQYWHVPLEN